jgi:ribosomal subunit interface protein
MEPSDAVEAKIREKVEWLERFYARLMRCHVVVEAPHQHSRQGNLYRVSIELTIPGAPPITVGRAHHDEHEHEDVYVAIRDAFAAA